MDITLTVVPEAGEPAGIDGVTAAISDAADSGFSRVWLPQLQPMAGVAGVAGWDALTALAVAGAHVPSIELGSGVAVAYTQHPFVLARQALTVAAATGGRFLLGVGVSHRFLVSDAMGYSFDAPAAFLREYLEVLGPALAGRPVEHRGERITAVGQLTLGIDPPPVLVAALGPRMLDVAGELSDGTLTTWTGAKAVEEHILPRITRAADAAGRATPKVIVGLPVSVTDDVDATRELITSTFSLANDVPAYRAMLDFEGVDSVADICLFGSEAEVTRGIRRFADVGATEFTAFPVGDERSKARTLDLLADLNGTQVGLAAV